MKKDAQETAGKEDVQKDLEKEIQDITDKRCKEIDALTAEKEKELMAV